VPGVALEDLGATLDVGATIASQRILPADALPGAPAVIGACPAYLVVEKRFDGDGLAPLEGGAPLLDHWPISATLGPSQLAAAPANPGGTAATEAGVVTFPVYPSQRVSLSERLPDPAPDGPSWSPVVTPADFQMGFDNRLEVFGNTCACGDAYVCGAPDRCELVDGALPIAAQAACAFGVRGSDTATAASPTACEPFRFYALVADDGGVVQGAALCFLDDRQSPPAIWCDADAQGVLVVDRDRTTCGD